MKKMQLTIRQVQQFLTEHTAQNIKGVLPLTGGNWSQAFAFQMSDKHYVVRFGKHIKDYEKDEIASEFSTDALPIAKVIEVGEAFDAYFAISERAFGEMLDKLDYDSMQKIVPAVMDMLNNMRQVNISKTTGYGAWNTSGNATYESWEEYLLQVAQDDPKHRTHGWRKKLEQSSIGDTAFNKAYEQLKILVRSCPSDRHIIHTDLLNDNVLVRKNGIDSIIDWGNSIYGDFLYDLAAFSYWASWFPSMNGIDWEKETKQYYSSKNIELPRFEERMLCYKLHIGLDAQAYNAFTERWDELEINSQKTLALCKFD